VEPSGRAKQPKERGNPGRSSRWGIGDGLVVVAMAGGVSGGSAKGLSVSGGQKQASVVDDSGFGLVMVEQNRG